MPRPRHEHALGPDLRRTEPSNRRETVQWRSTCTAFATRHACQSVTRNFKRGRATVLDLFELAADKEQQVPIDDCVVEPGYQRINTFACQTADEAQAAVVPTRGVHLVDADRRYRCAGEK